MPHRTLAAVLVLAALSLGACGGAARTDAPVAGDSATVVRDQGYALLYTTIGEECDVDKVLIIKRPAAPVADLIKAIGQFSRDAKGAIEGLAKEDPAIELNNQGLPEVETKTRDAISSATSKQIIFNGGKEFEFRILLTQHEALNYIGHLAGVLAAQEPRENRRQFLTQLAKRSGELHERVLAQLKGPYVGPPK